MKWYRWTAAAMGAALLVTRPAVADVVTGISNLSQANRLSVFHDYDIDVLGRTQSDIKGSAGGGVVGFFAGNGLSNDTAGSGRDFSLSITPIAGYDSNPEARRRAAGGAFAGGDLSADYALKIGRDDPTVGPKTELYFSYDATGAVYSGKVLEADTFQNALAANFRHNLFDDTVLLKFDFQDQFTMEHGSAFLNTVDLRPSVEAFLTRQTSAEIGYRYTNYQYYFPVNPTKNPDADRNTFKAQFHYYTVPQQRGPVPDSPDRLTDVVRGTLRSVTFGVDHDWNLASGRDYDYEGTRVYIGAEGLGIKSAPDLKLDVTYAHEWDEYKNPNAEGVAVFAGRGKARLRKDGLDIFTLRGNARLFDVGHGRGVVTGFVQWDLIQDHSNVFPRHFNEYVVSGGIGYRY